MRKLSREGTKNKLPIGVSVSDPVLQHVYLVEFQLYLTMIFPSLQQRLRITRLAPASLSARHHKSLGVNSSSTPPSRHGTGKQPKQVKFKPRSPPAN